ncbi:unnamed protein product [Commensalibacter communis]|nr:unnamed protein product [Commensalibacter communis]
MDDFYRSANGDLVTWYQNARPFSVFFFRILSGSIFPSDPYPFSFLFSFVTLYFTLRYTTDQIISEDNFLLKLSIFTLLLCNPFFLQNLSYKYDCVMMVMSIFCACFFVFKKKSNNKTVDYTLRCLIIFSLFCFYQSALSLVFGLMAIKMLGDVDNNKFSITIREAFYSVICIFVTFLIYKSLIANFMLTEGFIEAGKILPFDGYFLSQLFDNYQGYFKLLSLFLYKKYILISISIVSLFCLLTIIKDCVDKNYKRILVLFISIPLLGVSLTSCNIILSSPMYHMREMIGVNAVFVYIYLFIRKNEYITRIILCLPISFLLVNLLLSSAICNLKRIEYVKNELVIQDIVRSINYFGVEQAQGIAFISDDLQSPAKKIILKNYPLLEYFFDHNTFLNPWYANGIINGEFYLHKIITGERATDFPNNVKVLRSCYTETALKGVVLYVKVGSYCNSLPQNYNAGIF